MNDDFILNAFLENDGKDSVQAEVRILLNKWFDNNADDLQIVNEVAQYLKTKEIEKVRCVLDAVSTLRLIRNLQDND